MNLHPLVNQILTTGETEIPGPAVIRAHSYIPRAECELIYRAVVAAEASTAIEVGMAYGVSSLCIVDALSRRTPSPHLTTIDPCQTSDWHAGGMHLLKRAGFSHRVRLIEQPSHLALPSLLSAGERFRLGFIDGWHTFDHALVDFFYIDQMLEAGGVIVLDDVGYPAIHSVVRFILANRDYRLLEALPHPEPPSRSLRLRRTVKRALRPLARTDRDPSPANESFLRPLEVSFAVALYKVGHDNRRFDHFERF